MSAEKHIIDKYKDQTSLIGDQRDYFLGVLEQSIEGITEDFTPGAAVLFLKNILGHDFQVHESTAIPSEFSEENFLSRLDKLSEETRPPIYQLRQLISDTAHSSILQGFKNLSSLDEPTLASEMAALATLYINDMIAELNLSHGEETVNTQICTYLQQEPNLAVDSSWRHSEKNKIAEQLNTDNSLALELQQRWALEGMDASNAVYKDTKYEQYAFNNTDFTNCLFENVEFTMCEATDADFKLSEFVNVEFFTGNARNANFYRATFTDTQFVGMDLTGASFNNATFKETSFDRTSLLSLCSTVRNNSSVLNLVGIDARDIIFSAHENSPAINLRYVDLSESDLRGADLRGINLKFTHLDEANLQGAKLDRTALVSLIKAARDSYVDLTGVDLSFADLKGLDLSGVKLPDANLQGAKMDRASLESLLNDAKNGEISLKGVDFTGADLRGLDLRNLDLSGAIFNNTNLEGVNFNRTVLRDACFDTASLKSLCNSRNLSGQDIPWLRLEGVNLQGQDLREVNLHYVTLRGAKLQDTCLTGHDFRLTIFNNTQFNRTALESLLQGEEKRLHLEQINLEGQNLSGLNLSTTSLDKVNLRNAHMDRMTLQSILHQAKEGKISLQSVDFSGEDLSDMNLKGLDFRGANFERANLKDTKLDRANLEGTNMKDCIRGSHTEKLSSHHSKRQIHPSTSTKPDKLKKHHPSHASTSQQKETSDSKNIVHLGY